jgi:uncharacterized protein (UPF0332 family)
MITEFLEKAQENFEDAQVAFAQGRFNAASNRAYYAAFQAAIAALASHNIVHPKNPHDWVQAQFSGLLIKRRKQFPSKLASYLPSLQTVRDDADYKIIKVSKPRAARQVQMCEEFLSFIVSSIQP